MFDIASEQSHEGHRGGQGQNIVRQEEEKENQINPKKMQNLSKVFFVVVGLIDLNEIKVMQIFFKTPSVAKNLFVARNTHILTNASRHMEHGIYQPPNALLLLLYFAFCITTKLKGMHPRTLLY